jgi:hypothetical protein
MARLEVTRKWSSPLKNIIKKIPHRDEYAHRMAIRANI